MDVTFQRESVQATFEEAYPLLEEHWAQIAHYKDIKLNPWLEAYHVAEDADALRVYTVRTAGVLCGYALFFIKPNMHYRDSVQAVQDILWVAPEHRSLTLALSFLRWCDEQLRADGAQVVYHHVKHAVDFGPLLKRLGYESIETVWGRRLDK